MQIGQAIREPVSFGSKGFGTGAEGGTTGRWGEEKLEGRLEGEVLRGVPKLEDGTEDAGGSGSRATPQREHLRPNSTEGVFRIPQIWHTHARPPAAAARARRSRFLSRAASGPFGDGEDPPGMLEEPASESAVGPSERTSVILGWLLRKPTQYSVCLTADRSSAAELEWGRDEEMKTIRCVVRTARPSSYRGALSFLHAKKDRQRLYGAHSCCSRGDATRHTARRRPRA